ncbi:stage II sporulation protein M [Acetanaerobacterium elongatum]|uniref:Stage II sporulation protein M n=1 Tax=Acetanaerobacterium elongatum TaxID=258515 RepID=A0A1H0BCR4_9FIRM|nr:stage II sporulation protein M [Acetanaerobacterium elongatum]SDN43173.1 stage II sporulation protein M [Acetanaerobacterium elongatum]
MRRTTLNSLRNSRTYASDVLKFVLRNRLVYGMFALFLVGIAAGSLTVKYCNEPIAGELATVLSGYISKRVEQTFLSAFLSSFTVNFLILFLLFFLGFCAIGIPFIMFASTAKGFSLGVSIGYLYAACGTTGIWYAVENLVPVSLIASFAIILACASSYKLSGIYFSLFSNKNESSIAIAAEAYLTRYIVYTVLIFIAALVDGLCCSLFGGISP